MTQTFVGIGSNVGDRARTVTWAQQAMGKLPVTTLVACSSVYETFPVGPVIQGKFLNAVVQLQTGLDPQRLLAMLESIERLAGRTEPEHRVKWGPRRLDLDILLFGDHVIQSSRLVVPHPRMHERWFVLRPLVDVDPGAYHPVLNVTAEQLLSQVEKEPVGAV